MHQDTIFSDSTTAPPTRWPLHERKEVVCTPEAARKAYDTYQFRRQREISQAHVAKYSEAMKAGTFKPYSVVTIAMTLDGVKWLVDGNHTLLAVEMSGKNFPLTIEYRLVGNEADAAVLYSTFEARKRTLGAHMVAAGLNEVTGVSPSMLGRFTTGLMQLEMEFPAKVPRLADNAGRQALIARWSQWCRPVADILAGAPFNRVLISRASALAIMFLTMRYQRDSAVVFWSAIANNRDLKPGTPQHSAFNDLNTKSGRSCSHAEQFAALALAWNAYMDGKPLSFLRVFCGPIKVTVRGTPWNNRKTGTVKTERRS